MAVSSARSIVIAFTGDITYNQSFSAATNASSPGENELQSLAMGANTITPPSGAKSFTIIPPAGNTVALTLKGVTGDTGIALHLTDPTSVAIANAATPFDINAASAVVVRIIWS